MKTRRPLLAPLSLAALSLLLASLACGPTGGGTVAPTPEPQTGGGSGAVSSLDGVKSATIQIEAQGTFIDPEFGMIANAAGRGSGFIIDPSGIAVTNNHVVAGSALLRVYVGGEDEAKNATILGVSECSDLAVIDLEGDGYPYLDWFDGDIDTGLPIYAAGFPLGDPEYTLLEGIVAKARAGGETRWASDDYVIEHTADTNPGNSGGPIVTEDGQIVGVHYAGNAQTRQAWAISRDEALPVIERLQDGRDVDSIGVNGEVVMSEDGSLYGVWVAAVTSGSPADEAGVRGGDIITSLEGLYVGSDGTMADYCDVLRSHDASDTLAIEVLRYSSGEVLAGQLNGRPLETAATFATDLGGDDAATSDQGQAYTEYVAVQDDYGAIQMEVPTSWAEVDGAPEEGPNGSVFSSIWAAPNLQEFINTWGVPGVKFQVTGEKEKVGGHIQMLEVTRSYPFLSACTLDDRYDYNDGVYRGAFDYYTRCGGTADYLILAAVPIQANSDVLVFVQIQIVSQADLDAAQRILDTFNIVGSLP
ncbi:MAG TPA: S1C family serine protease [Anaerolineales bacterium]|nr:S1C family serine protease [Anaerolineales bacterium]